MPFPLTAPGCSSGDCDSGLDAFGSNFSSSVPGPARRPADFSTERPAAGSASSGDDSFTASDALSPELSEFIVGAERPRSGDERVAAKGPASGILSPGLTKRLSAGTSPFIAPGGSSVSASSLLSAMYLGSAKIPYPDMGEVYEFFDRQYPNGYDITGKCWPDTSFNPYEKCESERPLVNETTLIPSWSTVQQATSKDAPLQAPDLGSHPIFGGPSPLEALVASLVPMDLVITPSRDGSAAPKGTLVSGDPPLFWSNEYLIRAAAYELNRCVDIVKWVLCFVYIRQEPPAGDLYDQDVLRIVNDYLVTAARRITVQRVVAAEPQGSIQEDTASGALLAAWSVARRSGTTEELLEAVIYLNDRPNTHGTRFYTHLYTMWAHGSNADKWCALTTMMWVLMHEILHIASLPFDDDGQSQSHTGFPDCDWYVLFQNTFRWCLSFRYPLMLDSDCCQFDQYHDGAKEVPRFYSVYQGTSFVYQLRCFPTVSYSDDGDRGEFLIEPLGP